MRRLTVTLYGTLPPVIGMSEVSYELYRRLKKRIPTEFISFKHLYPTFLHPAKKTLEEKRKMTPKARYVLSIYNPLSLFYGALMGKGKIYHIQWWQPFLFLPYLPILLRGKLSKRKILLQVHNVLPHEESRVSIYLSRWAFKLADFFIVHNERMKNELTELFNIEERRIKVIPFGSYDFYRRKGISREEARRRLGIGKRYVILFFGNIRDYKGLDLLIEALHRLLQWGIDALLIIAGRPFGNWEYYRGLIEKFKLKENILLHLDFVEEDEVQYYFEASDVVVLPYKKFESLTGVGMVALSFEKPIIVSDVGTLRELVLDDDAVFVSGSSESLAEKLRIVLDNKLEKLKEDAKIIKEKFSWERTISKLLTFYREIESEKLP